MDNQNNTAVAFNNTPAFNLADFEASDTAWLELENIKGDGPLLVGGAPVRVEIRSPGTKEASSAQHKLETAATTRTYAAMRGKASKETVESKRAERVEKLLAVTVRFENFPAAPQEVFGNPKLGYITDQVAAFHGDWGNF